MQILWFNQDKIKNISNKNTVQFYSSKWQELQNLKKIQSDPAIHQLNQCIIKKKFQPGTPFYNFLFDIFSIFGSHSHGKESHHFQFQFIKQYTMLGATSFLNYLMDKDGKMGRFREYFQCPVQVRSRNGNQLHRYMLVLIPNFIRICHRL